MGRSNAARRGLRITSIEGGVGKGRDLVGVHKGFPAVATKIRARRIAVLAEYHEGGDLAKMFTVWGRISSLFPLRL